MDTPGPGSYSPADNYKSVVRRIPSHSIPRAPRFGTNTKSMATPSPANYDPNYNTVSVKRTGQSISFPKKKRFTADAADKTGGTPGFVYHPNHDSKSILNRAAMHSFPRSERDSTRMTGSLITPAPNSYDVDQSFHRVHNRKLNFTFRTAKREARESSHHTPGPDRYSVQSSSNVISRMEKSRSYSFGKSKRVRSYTVLD